MSGLRNTYKRILNFSKGKGYKTGAERQAQAEMRRQAQLDEIYGGAPMPDELEIRRQARRQQARLRGSRAETIMTDTLG